MALQVALFSENSARWLVADQSIMSLGAADAVSDSTLSRCSWQQNDCSSQAMVAVDERSAAV